MNKVGDQLNGSDILNLETELTYSLPNSYKDFLLNTNGGVPVESYIDFNENNLKVPGDEIKRFYGVGGKASTDLLHKMESIGDNLPKGMIFIANTHGGNFFLISLREDSYGEVFYKDHEYEDKLPFDKKNNPLPESMVLVAENFSNFLGGLYNPDE